MRQGTYGKEELEARVNSLVRKLRERGHRITPQRLAIIREFLGDRSHPTAEQIFGRLQGLFPTMALTTVHNTLNLLVSMGEAIEITPSAPAARFDPRPVDHCHLVCMECERILDVDDCEVVGWEKIKEAAEAEGFAVLHQVHEIYGICPECRERLGKEGQ